MKQTTHESYRRRLINVIDYIHNNINGDLDVNTLADVALMSPYHFHRIYREFSHETVNMTVRRLRLQRSAADLIRTNHSIASIAKSVSYSSQEAFSRAFIKEFGLSPAAYRVEKQQAKISLEPFIAMLPTDKKRYDTMFDVDIVKTDEVHLAGYPHQADYMDVGAKFDKLSLEANSLQMFNQDTRFIGVYYDDPETVPTQNLRSMASISVSKLQSIDSQFERLTIPSGECATLLFEGPYAELEKPYNYLFGQWLPNSGREMLDFPCFEEYLNDAKTTPPNQLLTRIYCLLQP